jgi:O-antigen ligase
LTPGSTLERAGLGLLAALAATIPVSIFASQVLLIVAFLVLVARVVRRETSLPRTPIDGPLLALVVWTLLAASFAIEPAVAHEESKKLLLFALFYLAVEALAPVEARERVLAAALLGGLAQAAFMVLQRHALGYDGLMRRPPGFLGHYMSASGVTMAVLLLATARIAIGPRARVRPKDLWLAASVLLGVALVAVASARGWNVAGVRLFVTALAVAALVLALRGGARARAAEAALPFVVVPIAAWALVVSQTRSAWAGAASGVLALTLLALVRVPRLAWAGLAVGAALLLASPGGVRSRLTVRDESSRDRYYMWQAGLDMLLDRPVFGQGPGMVEVVYARFRWPEAPNPQQPHLHNNLMQVAAERGLPGLVFFLWWVSVAFFAALREAQRAALHGRGPGWAAAGALAALAGVFVAGLFEYNLGDSEVLMLVLLLTAVPFAKPGGSQAA